MIPEIPLSVVPRHPDRAEAAIRFAIREIRYSQPRGTVQRLGLATNRDRQQDSTRSFLVRF